MIFVPSPAHLLHGKFCYGPDIGAAMPKAQNFDFLSDSSISRYGGYGVEFLSRPNAACSRYNLGLIAHFLGLAAGRGFIDALENIESVRWGAETPDQNQEMAMIWFRRALRMGSRDIYQYFRSALQEDKKIGEGNSALFAHSQSTESFLTAVQMANMLPAELGAKCNRFWHAEGCWLATLKSRNEGMLIPLQLKCRMIRNFNRVPFTSFRIRLAFDQNARVPQPPRIRSVSAGSSMAMPDRSFALHKESVATNLFSKNVFYSCSNRTQTLLLAFEYASADFERRNLQLTKCFLTMLLRDDPRGAVNSQLWRNKCDSRNSGDLVQCGFIAMILGDIVFALSMFEGASRLGNGTGSVMAGIVLAHFVKPRRVSDACFYFAKCISDPLALVHVGLFADDKTALFRAANLLGVDPGTEVIFECVGDVFALGIKVPQSRFVSQMFYGKAWERVRMNSDDDRKLILKINGI
jgi:hypothetical protein